MIIVEVPVKTIEGQLTQLSSEYFDHPESAEFVIGARAALQWILHGHTPPVEMAQAMRHGTSGLN